MRLNMCVYCNILYVFNCIYMWLKHAQTRQVSKCHLYQSHLCSTTECPPLSIWLDSRLRQVPQQISQANVNPFAPRTGKKIWGVMRCYEVLMLQMPVVIDVIVIAVCIILHVGLHVFTVDICDKANVSSKNVQTQ